MQKNTKYLKLPFQFNEEKLVDNLSIILVGNWIPHFNKAGYKGDWKVISLYAHNGEESNIFARSTFNSVISETPILKKCPYFKEVIKVLFNSVSMQSLKTSSNHYLNSLGYCKLSNQHTDRDYIQMLTWCIGDDKVQLLKWLLHTNLQRNKNIVIQLKTINAHAMGNINLGELNEAPLMLKVHLISYFTVRQMFECVYYNYYDREHHETTEEEIQTARLDATFRIVKELF